MSISPRTCQSLLALVNLSQDLSILPQLLSLSPSSGQSDEGGWGSQARARAARREYRRAGGAARSMANTTAQPRFTKSPRRFPSFWEVPGGGPVRPSPPPKKSKWLSKKNLRFFLDVGGHVRSITFATKSKFTKFPAHLPNFLRLYQISCGFPRPPRKSGKFPGGWAGRPCWPFKAPLIHPM